MEKQSAAKACKGILLAGVLFLTACTATPNPDARRQLPGYATPTGPQSWTVICDNRTVTGDWNDTTGFYNAEGAQKDRERFCDDIQAGTNIRRSR